MSLQLVQQLLTWIIYVYQNSDTILILKNPQTLCSWEKA